MSDAVSESQPLPPALTVGERILDHLRTTTPAPPMDQEMATWPYSRTQKGMAEALGLTRSHAALVLRQLQAAGYVDRILRKVDASRVRQIVYFLGAMPPAILYNSGWLKPLGFTDARIVSLRIALFRCPHCGGESRVALREGAT